MQDQFTKNHEKFTSDPVSALTKLVVATDTALTESLIDSNTSGSTAVVVFFDFKNIYVANVGDSRAVLGTRCDLDSIETNELLKISHRGSKILDGRQLTLDHKP